MRGKQSFALLSGEFAKIKCDSNEMRLKLISQIERFKLFRGINGRWSNPHESQKIKFFANT